jgi:ribose 1,5-bisphosphokinase
MDLDSGRHVIANVSRGIVTAAERRYTRVRCILVTASPELRAARLAGRQRESGRQVAERLALSINDSFRAAHSIVRNEGTIESGIANLLKSIQALAGGISTHG